MPLANGGGRGDVYDRIDKGWLNTNFIIQEACLVSGKGLVHVESMIFCVSFFNNRGESHINGTNMWIEGTVMNSLVSHKLKKKKFVLDGTIIHKPGWRHR